MVRLERGIAICDGGRSYNCTPNWTSPQRRNLTSRSKVLATEASVICL
jgi:hypothetical protein